MSEYIYNTAAKEATAFTKQRNAAFAREFQIDLEDAYNSEVALARRGCLKKLDGFRLKDKTGNVVWDLQAYDFLKQQAVADTVHPSLWLNGKAILRQVFLRCCRERSTRCAALMWRI